MINAFLALAILSLGVASSAQASCSGSGSIEAETAYVAQLPYCKSGAAFPAPINDRGGAMVWGTELDNVFLHRPGYTIEVCDRNVFVYVTVSASDATCSRNGMGIDDTLVREFRPAEHQ